MVPLNFATTGEVVEIRDIKGNEVFLKRLMEMGINRGACIKVIKNSDGPLIIGLGEGRIILGRGMAQKVMVEKN